MFDVGEGWGGEEPPTTIPPLPHSPVTVIPHVTNTTKAPCPVACVGLDPECPAAWLFCLVSRFAAYN